MKKIKFRGKSIYSGKIVYGDLTHYKHGYYIENDPVYGNSVAQLVGYDKNGKEIYEGDKLLDYDSETVVAGLIPFFRFEDVNNAGVYPVGYRFDIFTLKESQDETN